MEWQIMLEPYRQEAAELIGMIDLEVRWKFEHSDTDPDFRGFTCNKVLIGDQILGVISAAYYKNGQSISIAFHDDLPSEAEDVTIGELNHLVKTTKYNTYIWCKNEDQHLRQIIENTFHVTLNYASHEMSVSKQGFTSWKTPDLPNSYQLRGYEPAHHNEAINFLEQGMKHVSPPGTSPYIDRYDHLKSYYTELQKENRFHALWQDDTLVGICYSSGGEIETLCVNKDHRNKGLGQYLLYTAIQNAFRYRNEEIYLYVAEHNPGAFEFYKRCGMRVTGHSAMYFIDRGMGK